MSRFTKVLVLTIMILVIAWVIRIPSKTTVRPHIPPMAYIDGKIPHASGQSFGVDIYKWSDASLLPREMSLVKNNTADPTGNFGGYIRTYQYFAGTERISCTGSSDDNPGFGFLVNHYNNAQGENHWIASLNYPGTYGYTFRGAHHALHQYRWSMDVNGEPVDATVHWFIANGLDHPVFAVTYNLSRAKPNSINADSRSPYGDIGWDGDKKSPVSGVAWGDRFKFKTLDVVLSANSAWSYEEENIIPFNQMWSDSTNSEMGMVQTQTWQQHDAGGYWLYKSWGKKSGGPMPENWNWTYQLNQYQLESDPTSKRLAWGANYGAVGQTEYPAYGDDKKLSGYPHQSYSVYVVLGTHSNSAVEQQVQQMESVQSVVITGKNVEPKASGPAGVGRADETEFQPKGWNHVYGIWDLEQKTAGSFVLDFEVNQGTLKNPVFRIQINDGEKLHHVSLDGKDATPDKDYLLSIDEPSHTLWLTLIGEFSGSSRIAFTPLSSR